MLTDRLATMTDVPALRDLAETAISELLPSSLSAEQVEASRAIMGIDTRLVADGTYFVVECDGALAGCGGWSRRATMYGGDHSPGRDDALLDPATEPARVRAMYTHPQFTRRGVGRRVLALCEAAARNEGFRTLELVATRSGEPLYRAYGFTVMEPMTDTSTGVAVPLARMQLNLVSRHRQG